MQSNKQLSCDCEPIRQPVSLFQVVLPAGLTDIHNIHTCTYITKENLENNQKKE